MSTIVAPDIVTRAIHGGLTPDPTTGAILTPIHQSTTFVQEAVGSDKGFTYSRAANPTVAALERNLGRLEDAPPAACFSTGMAAIASLCLAVLQRGDHVIVSDVVYGGTVRLLQDVLQNFGVSASFVDTSDEASVEAALREETRLILIESPANPTLKLTDIRAIADVITRVGAAIYLAVDNTFLTPVLQRPLELGADLSVYSTTKFIEGHNSTVGGAIVTRDKELLERLRFVSKTVGLPQSPFEAWLTLRGAKTLPIRMQQHSKNALHIARWLQEHPLVSQVFYPDLESFAQYELAQTQQDSGGGVLAFDLHGGEQAGVTLMNNVKLISLAENLGAVESLITHPASMTHADVPSTQRAATGVTDGLIRLSVGLEHTDDIIADLEQALARAGGL